MSDTLQLQLKWDDNEKVLWVEDKMSWETQWIHAVALFNEGYAVQVHDHGPNDRCRIDGARCRCGSLTGGDDGPILVLVTPRDNSK